MNCYRLCKGIGTVSKAHSVIHRAAAAAGAGGGGRDGGGGRGDNRGEAENAGRENAVAAAVPGAEGRGG